jgi:hypothetical protein
MTSMAHTKNAYTHGTSVAARILGWPQSEFAPRIDDSASGV